VITEACLKHGPISGFTMRRLFPNHPRPAASLLLARQGRGSERPPIQLSRALRIQFFAMTAASEAGTGNSVISGIDYFARDIKCDMVSTVFAIL